MRTECGAGLVGQGETVIRLSEESLIGSLVAGAAVALSLLAVPAAHAQNPLASGSTTLKLDAGVARMLSANGVRVTPVSPARKGVSFPITGGSLDGAAGTFEHSGGLRFSAGGKSLTARAFTIKLARRSTLTARVGSARVPLLARRHEPGARDPRGSRHTQGRSSTAAGSR